MRKIVYAIGFIISFFTANAQINNSSFEDTSCDVCATLLEFEEGCVSEWNNYRYAPAAFDSSDNACAFYNGGAYQAPHGNMHAMVGVNSGIFQEGEYPPGTYSISFRYTRGEGIFEDYPVYINVGFANGMQNVAWNDESNLSIPIDNVVSQLVEEDDPVNWATYTGTFNLTSAFEDIVIYGSSTEQFKTAEKAPTMRALIDDFSLVCLDCPTSACDCINGGELQALNVFGCNVDFALGGYGVDGCATLIPEFTWNFGDGSDEIVTTSVPTGISHTFDMNGTYTVTVSFDLEDNTTGELCNVSYDTTVEITDCTSTSACDCINGGELQALNVFGCNADFALGGYGVDGCATLIPEFTWDFGDGSGEIVTTSIPTGTSHTFDMNGTYTVTVSFDLEDNTTGELCTVSYDTTVEITDCESTSACDCINGGELQALNIFGCNADFYLGGYGVDGCATLIPEFTWNFGDGSDEVVTTGQPASTSHTFDMNGTYTVTVSFDLKDNVTGELCNVSYDTIVEITDCENPCSDSPYVEPFWSHPDCPEVVCTATQWPVVVLDGAGVPINGGDVTINWVNTDDPALPPMAGTWNYVGPQQHWEITITYNDGCEYVVNYYEDCCEDDISIKAIECPPTASDIKVLEAYAEQNKDKLKALNKYELVLSGISTLKSQKDIKDCDPCDIGYVLVYLVDSSGNPIDASIYNSILWSNGDTTPQSIAFPNIPLTVVATQNNDGYTCTYEAEYTLDCEEKCSEVTPTNLQVVGTTLTWDPVPGAIEYIVSSPAGNVPQIYCGCKSPVSMLTDTTPTNSYPLSLGLSKQCFVWQVTAVCKTGEKSVISKQACYNGPKKGEKDIISIYPNPNTGIMDVKIETDNDTDIVLSIHKFDGTLIKTINTRTSNSMLNLNLNLKGILSKGLYFFTFNTVDNIITKKVMIE